MAKNIQWFVISDYHNNLGSRVVGESSPRKACIKYLETYAGLTNPKLFKIFQSNIKGESFHTGYGCGRIWLDIGYITPFRKVVK